MKIEIQNPEHSMSFNAVDKDGHVVSAGVACQYALSTSPRAAKYIVDREGHVLAVAVAGVAWVPTSRGLHVVTSAAERIASDQVTPQYNDGDGATRRHLARYDPDCE